LKRLFHLLPEAQCSSEPTPAKICICLSSIEQMEIIFRVALVLLKTGKNGSPPMSVAHNNFINEDFG